MYSSKSDNPEWVRYLDSIVKSGQELQDHVRQGYSNSALLVLDMPKSKGCAVFSFGYGKSLVQYDSIEPFFGRNVVLNSMGQNKILALKSRSYEQQPRHKENQGTVSSGLNEFGVDLEQEILQKMTGEYAEKFFEGEGFENDSIGRKLTGYDSLNLVTSLQINEIQPLCEWLCDQFESDRYKTVLPDIDSFCPVKSEGLIGDLNGVLVHRLKSGDLEGLHLSFPLMLDTDEYQEFSFRGLGKVVSQGFRSDSLSITDLSEALESEDYLKDLSFELLKSALKVVCFSNKDSSRHRSASIARSITAEIRHNGSLYALMNGKWYIIDQRFFQRIVSYLNKRVSRHTARLSPYEAADDGEGGYNKRQCSEFGYQLFDQKAIGLKGREL